MKLFTMYTSFYNNLVVNTKCMYYLNAVAFILNIRLNVQTPWDASILFQCWIIQLSLSLSLYFGLIKAENLVCKQNYRQIRGIIVYLQTNSR